MYWVKTDIDGSAVGVTDNVQVAASWRHSGSTVITVIDADAIDGYAGLLEDELQIAADEIRTLREQLELARSSNDRATIYTKF